MATPTDKDTIYVDIDDEITGIIDKVKASNSKVVALVLPKRASVFQSIVNMKLLKRAVDSSKKNLVLITSEAGLLPLAGAAGIHVAKTLSSRPEIPLAPQAFIDSDDAVGEDEALSKDVEHAINPNETVGQLAGDANAAPATSAADGVETLTLDNAEETPEDAKDDKAAKDDKPKKPKKDKSLKVPNFNRFRLALGILVLLIILAVGGFLYANASLAKATITISTNATNVPANLNLDLSTSASVLNASSNTIPAKYDQQQKTSSQQVGTTGQKNEGNKATGVINVSAGPCTGTQPSDIPAGTGVSANSQTYITQDDIIFLPGVSHTQCTWQGQDANSGKNSIPIIAQSGGSSYNVSGVPFTISSGYSATGNASGGTDNNVQVVNQADINNAKSKISSGNTSSIKEALNSQLDGEGYYPISGTFNTGTPTVVTSANVGDTATSVSVTETITYTMFGVHKSDLKTLVDNSVNGQIDTSKQSILDEGIDSAVFSPNNLTSSGGQVGMSTKAIAGPQLNASDIQQSAVGKKAGDIKSQILTDPNVTSVNVSFSPFWVSAAPKNTSKITVNIAKPTTTKSSR